MENIEIKARINNLDVIRDKIKKIKHTYVGLDHQVDTYFNTKNGRLKLRESSLYGPYLIPYIRKDISGPKSSTYQKIPVEDAEGVKTLFEQILGISKVIEKKREIYLYENVRIHLDQVKTIGEFIELEAVIKDNSQGEKIVQRTPEGEEEKVFWLMELFGIKKEDLISTSYENFKGK